MKVQRSGFQKTAKGLWHVSARKYHEKDQKSKSNKKTAEQIVKKTEYR